MSSDELNNLSEKTDNDKNTIYISKILENTNIEVKRVIYLTNTNGLLDEEEKTVLGGKIKTEDDKNYYRSFVEENKSDSGTGGMKSKIDCGFKVLEYGTEEAIIANAKDGLKCLKTDIKSTKFSL